MKIYLKRITGIDDAIVSMFVSKGNWNRELEQEIMNLCDRVLTKDGRMKKDAVSNGTILYEKLHDKAHSGEVSL